MLNVEDQSWLEGLIAKFDHKLAWVSEKSRDKIPYTTIGGTHDDRSVHNPSGTVTDGINWWTNGFWGGMMWLMYHATGQEKYKDIASVSEEKLDKCFDDFYGLHHDVGFMWQLTSVANYKLTNNPDSRKRALHAATLLAGRFNPVGGFLRAWNDIEGEDTRGWAIIDCMLNIPLLYWAAEETGDPRFRHIANMHADTAITAFVRSDGSVNHIVEFDPFKGGIIRTHGGQGYQAGSSWTRGQSWALYGFMMSYHHTGNIEYLNAAKRIAHYFISNIPENGVISVDFRQPSEPRLEDDTAAAIAACGLIEMAKTVEMHDKNIYLRAALKLLKALESRSNWTNQSDAVIQNGSAAYHANVHHQPMIYGDFFFLEAALKLKGKDLYLW